MYTQKEERLYTEREVWDKEVKAWLMGWLCRDMAEQQADWKEASA